MTITKIQPLMPARIVQTSLSKKVKYGFEWPAEAHDIFIDMILAKKWREAPYKGRMTLDPWEHLLRACRALFTKEEFQISGWTEEHAKDFTTEDFCITWGCASSSKSNDYGLFLLLDWLTDPYDTISLLASTSLERLHDRSFESVIRYFRLLKRSKFFAVPGKVSKTRAAIINDNDSEDADGATSIKAKIQGVAVQAGTDQEARAGLQGAHLPYVRLLADELSQMKKAVLDARINLAIGARDFRFFGLCNPDSLFDMAGQVSVPEKGWDSVSVDTGEWKTPWGKVRHHDGSKSPAVLETNGAQKYPYLINTEQIARVLKQCGGNIEDPLYHTMVRGFPPAQGLLKTVLTEAMVTTFHMTAPVVWDGTRESDKQLVAGLDPAFTSGGDRCVFRAATLGFTADRQIHTIMFDAPVAIPINSSSDVPVTYQIADAVLDLLEEKEIPIGHLAVDDSGTQSVADVIEMEYLKRYDKQGRVQRVVFNAKASDMPVSVRNSTPAKDFYYDRITELWYAFAEFGEADQIRGLDVETVRQLCMRRVMIKGRSRKIEEKKEMKKRLHDSPDEADSAAICMEVVRGVLGIVSGATREKPSGTQSPFQEFSLQELQKYDIDNPNRTYQTNSYPAEITC